MCYRSVLSLTSFCCIADIVFLAQRLPLVVYEPESVQLHDAQRAVVDQYLCAHAHYFIGNLRRNELSLQTGDTVSDMNVDRKEKKRKERVLVTKVRPRQERDGRPGRGFVCVVVTHAIHVLIAFVFLFREPRIHLLDCHYAGARDSREVAGIDVQHFVSSSRYPMPRRLLVARSHGCSSCERQRRGNREREREGERERERELRISVCSLLSFNDACCICTFVLRIRNLRKTLTLANIIVYWLVDTIYITVENTKVLFVSLILVEHYILTTKHSFQIAWISTVLRKMHLQISVISTPPSTV